MTGLVLPFLPLRCLRLWLSTLSSGLLWATPRSTEGAVSYVGVEKAKSLERTVWTLERALGRKIGWTVW